MPKKPPKDPPLVDFIEEKVALYGELFGLSGWRIVVKYRTQEDDSLADCIAMPEYKRADLAFDLDRLRPLPPKEIESVVRHEMLHILVWPLGLFAKSLWPKGMDDAPVVATEEKVVTDLETLPLWEYIEE